MSSQQLTTAVAEQEAERKAALKKIKRNEALNTLYSRLQECLVEATRQHVLGAYDVGELVQQASDDVEQYGHNSVELLATALGNDYSAQKLYQLKRLTVIYTRDRIQKLLDAKAKKGGSTFVLQHLIYLSGLEDAKKRKELEKRVIDEDLTYQELTAVVKETVGKRSNGGRGLKLPKTPESGAKMLRTKIEDLHKRRDVFERSIFHALDESPAEEMPDDVLEMLDQLDGDLLQGENDFEALRNQLDATRARIRNIKGHPAAAENPLEEEVPEADDDDEELSMADLPPDDDEDEDDDEDFDDFFDDEDEDEDLEDDEEFEEEEDDDFGDTLEGSDPSDAINKAKSKNRSRK